MPSPVDLINMALDEIGVQASVQGINPPIPPNSLAAQVASRNYQIITDSVFRGAFWNTGRYQDSLTLLKAMTGTLENPAGALPQPPLPWLYEYAYPSDCVRMRFLIQPPVNPQGSQPNPIPQMPGIQANVPPFVPVAIPFVRGVDKDANGQKIQVILTNVEQAIGVYTARVDSPDEWDQQLQLAVVSTLAAWLVNPLARNAKLLQERVQIAMSIIKEARVADANEGISTADHTPDWMQARGSGAAAAWIGSSGNGMGFSSSAAWGGSGMWDSVGLPGGIFF